MNTYGRYDVTFEKGIGAKIYDTEGKEYLDFVSGVAVNCLGHSHPAIVKAINDQSQKLIHISNYYWNTEHTKLAGKLVENSDLKSVFFCNSGTEAVEGGLKIARKYGKLTGKDNKNVIIYMNNSFHGRTFGALTVTGQDKYKKDFLPLVEGVRRVEFNNIESLKDSFDDSVCGMIIEPIQGEGGVNAADKDFLLEAKKLCEKFNALLIFDEVQCGMGRLGTLFAYKKFGVVPDIVCIAKALGGGFPIGAFVAGERAAGVLVPGDHGTTYGGNPLGSAVGNAIIDELVDNGVLENVEEMGSYIRGKLEGLKEKYSVIKDIRGMGLLVGIALEGDIKKFTQECFDRGLLLITAGKDVVRILPPLNVDKKDIDSALKIIEEVLKVS